MYRESQSIPRCPVVKTALPLQGVSTGSVPGWGAKIPYADSETNEQIPKAQQRLLSVGQARNPEQIEDKLTLYLSARSGRALLKWEAATVAGNRREKEIKT